MGRGRGRGAALTPALIETLAAVSEAMAEAREPWWVIGSAAVVLHGVETTVRDVDVLLSIADARQAAGRLGCFAEPGSTHPLFRSALFFAWAVPPLAVEFMAGFAVASEGAWVPVAPRTREAVVVGEATIFVPSRDEVRAMLASFGRPKDRQRLLALS